MKLTILIVLISIFFIGIFSCYTNPKQKAESNQGELKTIKAEDIKLNDIVHDELSKEQIDRIKKFKEILKEVDDTPLEKTIENFRRDLNPDSEISIWERIAEAYQKIGNENQALKSEEKKEIYVLLLYCSMMPQEEVLKKMELKSLSMDQAKEFIKYYR